MTTQTSLLGRRRASSQKTTLRPLAPHVPRVLAALDPGTMHLGYAVLRGDATRLASGTWIPKSTLSVLDRHLWLLSRIQDLLAIYQPAVLVYEEFTWRVTEDEGHPLRGRSAMERLMGGIQALALCPPYPVLMPLLPQAWGHQLYGTQRHSKQQVAWAVNQRQGTSYQGNRYDSHEADAVGLALVALDTLRAASYTWKYGH